MVTEIRTTEVNLDGLLEVLGENLYSTPIVAVRELIQNSHDACVRRRVEADWQENAEIRISTDPAKLQLIIQDNGSGLSREEIIKYLATIGSGYTRVLRQRSEEESAVGYFGLGFLTAYVVTEQVDFLTKSYQDDHNAWRFSSKGGQAYKLDSANVIETGSTVILHLKDVFGELSNSDFLMSLIQQYCCLLPIDIYLDDYEDPVNRIDIPWLMSYQDYSELRIKKANIEFAKIFDHDFEPIVAFPIKGDEEYKLNGLMWIQDGSYYASSDNRVTSIFIRSMHITNECKELLPDWAGFVGCVIDTPMLTPTASRESVQQDVNFEKIKEIVSRSLVDYIAELADKSDASWRRLFSRHNQALLGAAVSDWRLFDAMQDKLAIPTSEGELTVEEILQISGDNTVRITLDNKGNFEQLISKCLGIPVVLGYRFAVTSFCRRKAEVSNIKLATLGTTNSNEDFFPEHDVDDQTKSLLLSLFKVDSAKTIISHFEPASLPLVKIDDQDALLKRRIESDEMDKHVGSATMMLARAFTDKLEVEEDSYFFVNYNNTLISELIELSREQQNSLAKTILQITQLMSGSFTQDTNNASVMEKLNDHLLQLIRNK